MKLNYTENISVDIWDISEEDLKGCYISLTNQNAVMRKKRETELYNVNYTTKTVRNRIKLESLMETKKSGKYLITYVIISFEDIPNQKFKWYMIQENLNECITKLIQYNVVISESIFSYLETNNRRDLTVNHSENPIYTNLITAVDNKQTAVRRINKNKLEIGSVYKDENNTTLIYLGEYFEPYPINYRKPNIIDEELIPENINKNKFMLWQPISREEISLLTENPITNDAEWEKYLNNYLMQNIVSRFTEDIEKINVSQYHLYEKVNRQRIRNVQYFDSKDYFDITENSYNKIKDYLTNNVGMDSNMLQGEFRQDAYVKYKPIEKVGSIFSATYTGNYDIQFNNKLHIKLFTNALFNKLLVTYLSKKIKTVYVSYYNSRHNQERFLYDTVFLNDKTLSYDEFVKELLSNNSNTLVKVLTKYSINFYSIPYDNYKKNIGFYLTIDDLVQYTVKEIYNVYLKIKQQIIPYL